MQLRLLQRPALDHHLGVGGDGVDGKTAGDRSDVSPLACQPVRQRHQGVDGAGRASIPPGVSAGAADADAAPQAADVLDDHVIQAVAFEGDRRRRSQLGTDVQRTAQIAEALFADGECDCHAGRKRGQAFDRPDGRHHRGRVVADAGPDELVTVAMGGQVRLEAEDRVDVNHHQQPRRVRVDAPDQIAGGVALPVTGQMADASLDPSQPRLLGTGGCGDRRELAQLTGDHHLCDLRSVSSRLRRARLAGGE